MNYLGKFLEKKLCELKMSEREMAKKCEISHSYLNQIIKGVNPSNKKPISPTLASLEKISKGFNVPVESLQKIAMGVAEEEVFINEQDSRSKFLEKLERKAKKEGIPIGSKGNRVIPWEVWNQIKEAQDFIACLGIDPSKHSEEDWAELLDDIKLVIKLHLEKRKK